LGFKGEADGLAGSQYKEAKKIQIEALIVTVTVHSPRDGPVA
jgi:hypothetical protein